MKKLLPKSLNISDTTKSTKTAFNCRTFTVTVSVIAVLTVLFSFLSLPSSAVEEVDQTGQGIGFSSVLYDSTNGLPTSEANAVAQSSNGMIWIGGYSGLTRYDGNEFYSFPASTGISSVNCLLFDADDTLWIGTNDSGVVKMHENSFDFYGREQGLTASSVRSLAEDGNGNILIATTMGLAYINEADNTVGLIDDPRINKEYICELEKQGDRVFGVTLSGCVIEISGLKVTAFYAADYFGDYSVNTMFPDPENDELIYIGTQSDEVLHAKLGESLTVEKSLSIAPQNTVNDIKFIDGQLWICSDNGIGFFYGGRYTIVTDVPITNSVDRMMIDYEENLWFCSSRQGLLKITQNSFIDIFKLAGLEPRVVNSTCKLSDNLYIGTDTGLIILDSNYKPVASSLTEKLEGVRIRCIKSDSNGRLWLCTYSDNGLVCYNPKSGSVTNYNEMNGLASSRVRMIKELPDGSFAVATNAGVSIIENGAVTKTYNNADGVSNLEILTIEQGDDGTVYLGSDGDGIYVVRPDSTVRKIGVNDGLKSEVILRLINSPTSTAIWIVTSNSIAYYKDGIITTVQNFPYSNNYDIYFDSDGYMWVLSSNGIYVVKQSDMLKNGEIDYTLYDISCGLPSVATVNSYSELDEDGRLYVACVSGVSMIDINEHKTESSSIRLAVPFVTADDEYIFVSDGDTVHIPSSCKRLNIYANALTYSLNNPRLSYYLEGFEDEPIVTTKRNMKSASYTNLKGGTYKFHFSLLDSRTGEEIDSITLTIVKNKALYEQSWFLLLTMFLFAITVAAIIALYFRKKTAKLVKKEEENRKLINEMTTAFAKCIDMKDQYTNGHSFRVAKYTAMLAEKLGKSKREVERIYNIALLHDIGKISIPDSILNKPGKLSDEEYDVMKSHSQRGNDILKDITIAPDLALGAGYHHERIDGKGYPAGLSGEQIPEVAQIIAVADTFDAMYSTRPYRKKMELSIVAEEIERSSGTQLSEKVVTAFEELYREGAFDEEESIQDEQE